MRQGREKIREYACGEKHSELAQKVEEVDSGRGKIKYLSSKPEMKNLTPLKLIRESL